MCGETHICGDAGCYYARKWAHGVANECEFSLTNLLRLRLNEAGMAAELHESEQPVRLLPGGRKICRRSSRKFCRFRCWAIGGD